MKKFAALMVVLATCMFAATGCGEDEEKPADKPAAGNGSDGDK